MNFQPYKINAVVIAKDTPSLFKRAKKLGLVEGHPAVSLFESILCDVEDANSNKVRLSKEATIEAIDTIKFMQVNFNHVGKGAICGVVFDSWFNEKNEVVIDCIFFKKIYKQEYEHAKKLFAKGKLTMSFEITQDKDTEELLSDGTKRVNNFYFTGAGLLMNVPPACKNAIVDEFASKLAYERQEVIYASARDLNNVTKIKEKEMVTMLASLISKLNQTEEKGMLKELFANIKQESDLNFEVAMSFYYASADEQKLVDEEAAKWTRKFINGLPDSAFAVIEPDYPDKTDDKNTRHLPHHNGEGDLGKAKSNDNLDLPHLRNALSRMSQIKPISDSISETDLQKNASTHLERHQDALDTNAAFEEQKALQTLIVEEKKSVSAEIIDDEQKTDTMIYEYEIVVSRDGKVIRTEKSNSEVIYMASQIETMKSEQEKQMNDVKASYEKQVNELKATLEAKGSEIETVRANAEKIGKLKVEFAANEFTKEFKSEDWLNDEKLNAAKTSQVRKEKIQANKDALKDNEFAKEFKETDYADDDKVVNVKLQAQIKASEDKIKELEAKVVPEVKKEDMVAAVKKPEIDMTTHHEELTAVKKNESILTSILKDSFGKK